MKGKKHWLMTIIVALALAGLTTLGLAVAHPSVTAFAGSAAPGTYQIFCLTTDPNPGALSARPDA